MTPNDSSDSSDFDDLADLCSDSAPAFTPQKPLPRDSQTHLSQAAPSVDRQVPPGPSRSAVGQLEGSSQVLPNKLAYQVRPHSTELGEGDHEVKTTTQDDPSGSAVIRDDGFDRDESSDEQEPTLELLENLMTNDPHQQSKAELSEASAAPVLDSSCKTSPPHQSLIETVASKHLIDTKELSRLINGERVRYVAKRLEPALQQAFLEEAHGYTGDLESMSEFTFGVFIGAQLLSHYKVAQESMEACVTDLLENLEENQKAKRQMMKDIEAAFLNHKDQLVKLAESQMNDIEQTVKRLNEALLAQTQAAFVNTINLADTRIEAKVEAEFKEGQRKLHEEAAYLKVTTVQEIQREINGSIGDFRVATNKCVGDVKSASSDAIGKLNGIVKELKNAMPSERQSMITGGGYGLALGVVIAGVLSYVLRHF